MQSGKGFGGWEKTESEDRERNLAIVARVVLIVAVFLLRFLQVLAPPVVGLALVHVGEDEGEDVLVPVYRLAFDAFLDVLLHAEKSAYV